MKDTSFLNNELDIMTRANSFLNPMDPKPGILLIGNQGIEFRAKQGSGFIQVPWQAIEQIRVQIFFNGLYIRGFFIETSDEQLLEFVVSDAKRALGAMKQHLNRDQFITNPSNFGQLFNRIKGRFNKS